jgi:hypothetical protein
MSRYILCFAVTAGLALLPGCQSLERRDTLALHSGDAIAWNKAVHTIDPWPAASSDTAIPVSGRRIARAIEIYEAGPPPSGIGAPGAFMPISPFAPGVTPGQ